jgi:hypothetical protein
MSVDELIKLIKEQPEKVGFDQVIDCIDDNYEYTPTPVATKVLARFLPLQHCMALMKKKPWPVSVRTIERKC